MDVPVAEDLIPEGATCRICRGEHSADQPLFHPCKCRGSIKYIHESCLMEWVASKNVDLSRPGSEIKCDICHFPIQLTTVYDEDTPDKVPLALIIRTTLGVMLRKLQYVLCIALAASMLVVGIPLTWNILGKLIATILYGGKLPIPGSFWKSIVFGFDSDRSETASKFDIAIQILKNYRFSVTQIVFVAVIHIALYFQYDMVVREAIFNKMVYHKIGPRFSKEELMTEKLKQQFPGMDENTIHHIVQLMKTRERAVATQPEANPIPDPDVNSERDDDNRDVPGNDGHNATGNGDGSDRNSNENSINIDLTAGSINQHTANSTFVAGGNNEEDDEEDADYNPSDTLSSQSSESSNNASDQEIDDDEREQLVEQAEPINLFRQRRAVNELDDMLQAQQQGDAPQGQANDFIFMDLPNDGAAADGVADGAGIDEALNQQDGPAVLGLHLRFSNLPFYYMAASIFLALYLFLAYAVPTIVGNLLLTAYAVSGLYIYRAIALVAKTAKLPLLLSMLGRKYSSHAEIVLSSAYWIQSNSAQLYYNYLDYENRASTVAQSIPALTTYCTFLGLISISTNLLSRGYGINNGMKNPTRRFIFQLFFAIRCSLKVFLLFSIELVGFPVLAGSMIDYSLISPCLRPHSNLFYIGGLDLWAPTIWVLYWSIGTYYMFWFAKYVGMIRNYIIRPGVLFFIRSSDDPNIRILHDSLIHPMRIQFSRMVLSMGIYAVFIIVGFGFHTRVLFPYILNSKILPFADEENFVLCLNVLMVLNSNFLMDFSKTFKLYVRQYWTRVFDICCGKLRLSSFILDKDISTERGYVVYRNAFYRLFLSRKAKWSNVNLYLDPKTPSLAKELFKTQKDVHAFFIPDGVLMRVPANDIISRNYVQTLFVPVTKDNKLLKPLDIEYIKERNRENVGEFGHLDDQSTEFDAYTTVYTPPNFRARYSTLIALIWLFASLLCISLALIFNLVGRVTLLVTMGPFMKVPSVKEFFIRYRDLTAFGLFPMIIGCFVCLIGLEFYQEILVTQFVQQEHVVRPHEDDNAPRPDVEIAENERLREAAAANANAGPQAPFLERVIWQRRDVMSYLIGVVGAIKYLLVLDFNYSTTFMVVKLLMSGGRPVEIKHRFLLAATMTEPIPDFEQFKSPEMAIYIVLFLLSFLTDEIAFFSYLVHERQDDTNRQLKGKLKSLIAECLLTAGLVFPIQLLMCMLEYLCAKSSFESPLMVFNFLMNSRGLVAHSEVPWTMFQVLFYAVSPLLCGGYYLAGMIRGICAFLQKSAAITKEEVYGRGRTLTNLSDETEL
ncbi:LAME_0H18228g1_1 [Lachancea meyersii CBS 8951]|uniref:RING-type E3 ubiquitin transferase n=1 Tax=Lachancea meyersii CBS 8951 TaxID=1266667 RepID=A0A1G4KIM7_9SACH|nr:LAME_0H18228g1_1 [Lachancea meyersii CBS 8951]